MYSNTTTVTCPWCRNGFSVPIGAKYRSAEAVLPNAGAIDTDVGQTQCCPNNRCQQPIFVHFMK
jgi:hypothetical protein